MLALVAGQGRLPEYVAQRAEGPLTIAALEGFPPDTLSPDRSFRIEHLGSFLAALRETGVTQICFAGGIRRPSLDPSAIDAATMPLVPRMMDALRKGDDAALRVVLTFFEEAGIEVKGAHEIADDLLPPVGSLTQRQPTRDDAEETQVAARTLEAISSADIGQACVIRRGRPLAIETHFGTDWMLESLANRPDDGGGILYKAPKTGQDRRIDLPVIGPGTVRRAAQAGLDGVAIEAGGVMLIDAAEAVAEADKAGLFIWVRKP